MAVARITELLGVAASGITLLSADQRFLSLRAHDGLSPAIVDRLVAMRADKGSLLAHTVKTGKVQVVESLRDDERVTVVRDDGRIYFPDPDGLTVQLASDGHQP